MGLTRDKRLFEALQPEDIEGVLRSYGWAKHESSLSRADVWIRESFGADADLLVPKSRDARDYGLRVAEVVRAVSSMLSIPEDVIVRQISGQSADVVRLSYPSANEADASIGLQDGAALVLNGMELLSAAASSTVEPRAVLAPRRPALAVDYMKRVELGQSERGSYVMSIISRVAPQLTPGAPAILEFIDDPFPRRVTRTLVSALAATTSACAETAISGSFAVFEERVEQGVSANLCEALAKMVSLEKGTPTAVGVAVEWAKTNPVSTDVQSSFSFDSTMAPLLHAAAGFLKSREPVTELLLTGVVVDLHRAPTEDDGEISVLTVIDNAPRMLRVPLTSLEYSRALAAHDRKLPVVFRADASKVGRLWRASNVSDFRVAEELGAE